MGKKILFIVITFLFHCEIEGNPLWRPIDNSNSEKCITITTIESNENVYKAKIEIHGYYDDLITMEGAIYHQLSFDEPGLLSFVGKPALPIISRLIAMPKGENLDVKIKDEKWSEEFYVGQVMPSQRSVLETEKEPPFEKDDTVYGRDEYKTEIIYTGQLQKWRGINNRALNICPIRYMPKDGKMSILKEFVLDITFEGVKTSNTLKTDDMRLFINSISTEDGERINLPRDSTESYDYLIIAGDIPGILESQALADFQRWKAFKGYRTKVVSTNSMQNVWTMGIKQLISNESIKGIKYVLLIGDSDKIPSYGYYVQDLARNVKSDYWYGCMDGNNDVEADICIGRFSTNDLSEFTNMVNKTISYEKNARGNGNEVLLVAHQEGAPNSNSFQGCSEIIRTRNYYDSMSFSTAYGASFSAGGDSATNAYVTHEINNGKNIVNYRGHGDYNNWILWNIRLESYYNHQIDSLCNATNDIYFCVACLLGDIYNKTCFMETFMRSNHGASAMIAATEETYHYANNSYNKYLFSYLLNNNGIYRMGDLNIAAHITNIGTGNSYAIWNAFSYLCGGDPSLEIITDNTNSFEEYEVTLNGSNLVINTGNIEEYKVCIVSEDDSLISVINTTSSLCSFPIPTRNSYIVLNKHNYVPCIIYVNVEDSFIQNKVFGEKGVDYYYMKNSTISAGCDVTTSVPYGNVKVENGCKLNIRNRKSVLIKNRFECKLGGELQIK